MCKLFKSYEENLHLGVCKLAKYVRNCVVSAKIYTADKNFTRPPVATVATNSKSGSIGYKPLRSEDEPVHIEGSFC